MLSLSESGVYLVNFDLDKLLVNAAIAGDIAEVKRCLSLGANPNALASNGETALIMAAAYFRESVVEVLISSGADPSLPENEGFDSLMSIMALHRDLVARTEAGL